MIRMIRAADILRRSGCRVAD